MVRLAWTRNRSWLVAIPAILLAACGGRSDLDFGEDGGGVDGGPESGVETGPDAPHDVVYDHVNDINGCNPGTCGGCCDEVGNCRTGLESTACGIGGYACVDCASFNATCNATTHQCGSGTKCGPATCPNGCCDGDACVEGTSDWACGTGGQACATCPSDSKCDPGIKQCVTSQNCGPWNCSGCCDAYGQCNWGGDAWACGWGGNACEDCSSMGMGCDPYSYACMPMQDCGPWNCDGCCDAYGYCNWGGDDWACGWGGGFCDDCWSMGMTCDPYQNACVPQQDCGPWNCDGCCDAWGYCNWGMDDWACGGKGQACEDCSMYGGYCDPDIMACSLPVQCGPDNCSGCCDPYSGECRYGWDPWACGTGGQVCMDCNGPDQECSWTSSGGGVCLDTSGECGPHNCDGCCDCQDPTFPCQCMPGVEPYACGSNGQICQYCGSGSQFCEPSASGGGLCVSVPPPDDCGPWNCPGCCTNTYPSKCVEGLEPWQCGSEGQICETCAPNEYCDWMPWGGGACVTGGYPDGGPPPPPIDAGPGGCGPWNCNGCCTPNGQCRPGKSDQRCGSGGEICENCAVQNLTCYDGDCVP